MTSSQKKILKNSGAVIVAFGFAQMNINTYHFIVGNEISIGHFVAGITWIFNGAVLFSLGDNN